MITTAIILVGGFGTRLKSVVPDVPKPMAPINNQPFLNYQLAYLEYFGIRNIVFSTGYLSEQINAYYKTQHNGLQVIYSHENTPLGTGGAIKLALKKIADEEILVLNGDSFFDVDLQAFYRLHKKNDSDTSLTLRKVNNASRYGNIEINMEGKIASFKEKNSQEKPGLINGGIYIVNKKNFLDNSPTTDNFSIEKDFFEKQIHHLKIYGFNFNGYFIDIGIPEDYLKAQHDFKTFEY
jgi:D-glycero-alpha-D-manno-heptose 1-phosphate guanylyltransferase